LLIGRTDFRWKEYRTLAEFDGKVKYEDRYLASGESAADVLWQEKKREDELRRLGYEIVRIIWADLDKPLLIARRVRDAFKLGQRRAA
jgi:hypothetical protein